MNDHRDVEHDDDLDDDLTSDDDTQDEVSRLTVEFCGEEYDIEVGDTFTIGREADLVVDEDNPYLHRQLVDLRHERGLWWITNVGSRLSLTVTGEAGTLQSVVGPGSQVPVVLPELAVLFTAGETTYEVNVHSEAPTFVVSPHQDLDQPAGDRTLGAVELTPTQFRLILALAEGSLRRAGTGISELPSNAKAAERLGWPITTFNRKLDNVCDKFSAAGVKGLRGGAGRLATNRRARLVEYAVAARIVRPEHLELLDEPGGDG
ncbi:hypothetical protein [Aeromicrobium alkaliterrae]|uniref:FHA domain-containing protein n=1 Tax=Aeromicrobium alkaliterrae TaxID=302168 RepID=A0ABN2KCE2_9ACTN